MTTHEKVENLDRMRAARMVNTHRSIKKDLESPTFALNVLFWVVLTPLIVFLIPVLLERYISGIYSAF